MIEPRLNSFQIADAIAAALESQELRAGAERMAAALAAYDGGARAVEVIDSAAGR